MTHSEELEFRKVEVDYHQKLQTMARRSEALDTAHKMLRNDYVGEVINDKRIDPKEVFKLANQIIKFIEKEA
tara:strand:+ start:593 stop:808 length:216 start_codon:yes stop_codon:yes gene_type:complete